MLLMNADHWHPLLQLVPTPPAGTLLAKVALLDQCPEMSISVQ